MTITIEISHYPLVEIYEASIIGLIKKLKTEQSIKIYTNAMSTYVQGEYDLVMQTISTALKEIYQSGEPSSTVIKIIPRDLPLEDGWLTF